MNLFELFVKIGVDDSEFNRGVGAAKKGFGDFSAWTIAKGQLVADAIKACGKAFLDLSKIGIKYNSQMEQYTTNFTTMLGSQEAAIQKVQELKEFAASTPLSMDDLAKGTQTLLAFGVESENSTGILRQLGDIALGNADKMQRLSTAFGKATASGKLSGEVVQQMIDAGWNPLIQISKAAGETMEETQKRMSAGKISVEELQAAMEAVTTGTGQFAGGMEAASHTTQGLISTLQDNARALVGDVFMPISDGLLKNVLPGAIEAVSSLTTAFRENGISGMIEAAGDIIGSAIGEFTKALPNIVKFGASILEACMKGISENSGIIITAAFDTIMVFADSILNMLPKIAALGFDLIVSLADGIGQNLGTLIPTIVDVVLQIVDTLTNPDTLSSLLDASIAIIIGLANGLIVALPNLLEKAPTIVQNLVTAIVENAPKLLVAAVDLIIKFAEFLTNQENLTKIIEVASEIISTLIEGFGDVLDRFVSVGEEIVEKIKKGISDAWDGLKKWFNNLWDSLFGNREVNVGVTTSGSSNNNNKPPVDDSAADGLYYVPFDGFIAELHKGERVLTAKEASAYNKAESYGNTSGITIIQNIQAVPQTPVELAAATQAYFEQARWAFA